ncbi:MAG: cellulose binding domain-containing protein [Micromonosporaceae bacterium]|nr:cellulose binding domain-containing protein [Micromonosporaceae bacterium]
MKNAGRSMLLAAALGVAMAGVVPSLPALAATESPTVAFSPIVTKPTGHTTAVTITNDTTAALRSWTIEFDLPIEAKIKNVWGANLTGSGTHYIVKSRPNARTMNPGSTVKWSYTAAGPFVQPSNCTINGRPCGGASTPAPTPEDPAPSTPAASKQVVAYYPSWAMYGADFHIKDVETSGQAAKLTHLVYGFGNTTDGQCVSGDAYADYGRAYTAENSVDGVADSTAAGTIRGNFGQLLRLKRMHPDLKILYSFGGWTWSAGFAQAAANPEAFADSCYNLVNDPRWSGLFDGIDIDWEFPNVCAAQCDTSGWSSFSTLMRAIRDRFGASAIVTAAIAVDASPGGMLDKADYAGAAQFMDWVMPMTYGYAGSWTPTGPTGLHGALTTYDGIINNYLTSDATVTKLKAMGIPASKILLGVDSYGRGWAGVTSDGPGGTATGMVPGIDGLGSMPYHDLKTMCPVTGTAGGTAYAKCADQWWSYDTPETLTTKTDYVKQQGLGGAFLWELGGDSAEGELVAALSNGLR